MPKPHLSQKTIRIILSACFTVTSLALRPMPHAQEITPPPENTPEPYDSSQLPVFVSKCEGEECTFHQEIWPVDQLEVIPEADETVTSLAAARITDLNARPLPDGRWKICFTAPIGTDAGAVLEFRSRDDDPLTLANWNDRDWSDGYGTAYWSGLGHPGTPGVYHCLYMKTEYPEWDWDMYGIREYFGARVINGDGSVSTISNIPSLYDTGFRPYPDGYKFTNFGTLGHLYYGLNEAIEMFGFNQVCYYNKSGGCSPKNAALKWIAWAGFQTFGGNCYGISTTTSNFYRGTYNPRVFGSSQPSALNLTNALKRHINYHHLLQYVYPNEDYINSRQSDSLADSLGHLYNSEEPLVLAYYFRDGDKDYGHAITPYAVEDNGYNSYYVWMYDSNHPKDINLIYINLKTNTWYYDRQNGTWRMFILDPPQYKYHGGSYPAPWSSTYHSLTLATNLSENFLIIDSLGNKTGFLDGTFVNEIPEAYQKYSLTNSNEGSTQSFSLPANDTYTITLDGQDLSEAEAASLSQFGPGFAISLDDLTLSPGGQSSLTISPDGAEVSLQSGEDQPQASIALARDGDQTSTEFQIAQAEVSAGQTLSLTADDGSGAMIFQNGDTASTTYRASISRSSESGRELFLAKNLSAAPGETYAFDTASWFGPEGINVLVDENNDGSFDSSMYLDNQAAYLFVPLISDSRPNIPAEAAQPASEVVQPAAVQPATAQPTPTATPTQVPMEPSPTATRAHTATASPTNEPTDHPTAPPLILTVADTNGSGAQAVLTLPDPQIAGDLTATLEDGVLTLRSDTTMESQIDIALQTEDGAPTKIYNGLRVKAKGVYVLSPDQNEQILALKADLDGDGQSEIMEFRANQTGTQTMRRNVMVAMVVVGILFGLALIVAGILLLMRVRRKS